MKWRTILAITLALSWHPALVQQAHAPTPAEIEWPEVQSRPAPRPAVGGEVEWLWKMKGAGGMTDVTQAILNIAIEQYTDIAYMKPVVTGTTVGVEYMGDTDHLDGCAIDLRTHTIPFAQQLELSQAIAAEMHAKIDTGARVVLWTGDVWWDGRKVPAHIHAEIQDCGRPANRWALWSWNHYELGEWKWRR